MPNERAVLSSAGSVGDGHVGVREGAVGGGDGRVGVGGGGREGVLGELT